MLQVIPNVHLFLFLNFKLNEQDSRDHESSEERPVLPACGGGASEGGWHPGGGRARLPRPPLRLPCPGGS